MKITNQITILIALLLTLSGCTYKRGVLAVAGSKDIALNMQEFQKVEGQVVGKSTGHVIILIPTSFPTIDEAIDNALKQVDGDIMTNVTIYYKWWMIPILYYKYIYEVEGEVWKIKDKSMGTLNKRSLDRANITYKITPSKGKYELIEIKGDAN